MSDLNVTHVRLVAARPDQIESGMLGYVSLVLGDMLRLDGIALRRTLRGHPALSFPCRRDRRGRNHDLVAPVNDDVRRRLERMVFDALDLPKETR